MTCHRVISFLAWATPAKPTTAAAAKGEVRGFFSILMT